MFFVLLVLENSSIVKDESVPGVANNLTKIQDFSRGPCG